MKTVYITGHRNPDLDSICASYAYANLKNIVDKDNKYIGVRCGHLSDTVKKQVSIAGIETVPYLRNIYPKVSDVMMTGDVTIQRTEPIYNLIHSYDEDQPSAIPVFDGDKFFGLLSINDITRWFLKENKESVPLYNIRTQNIAMVLPGMFIQEGKDLNKVAIIAGDKAISSENNNSVVVMEFRPELFKKALEEQVPAIVVTSANTIGNIDYSKYKGSIFVTELGTAEAIRRLRMAESVEMLTREQGPKLTVDTTFEDAKQILIQSRLRGLSVFDGDNWAGFVTRRCFLNKPVYNVILVDHNEVGQSIRGIETANVLEIIDHHRLDALKTDTPIYIDSEPVGSTCTIVYQQYLKNGVKPDKINARTLLVGIISDTLILKSPTTTSVDVSSAQALAKTAEIDNIQAFGEQLFSGAASLATANPENEIKADFKQYCEKGLTIGIGQCEVTTLKDIDLYSEKYIESLVHIKNNKQLNWAMLMITDVLRGTSILLITDNKLNDKLPFTRIREGVYSMPGIVSRKKQLLPEILHTLD